MKYIERFGILFQWLAVDGGRDVAVTVATLARCLDCLCLSAGEGYADGQVKFFGFRHIETGDEALAFLDANDVVPAFILQLR